jgi:hypothetical protein
MAELTNWKTLFKKESWGSRNFGIEVRVAVDRELNENDKTAMYRIADEIEDKIMRETVRTDPAEILDRAKEQHELLGCFPVTEKIFAEEIPNGYCSRWCCEMRPWQKVTTSKGVITLGWRKRVIEISWEPRVNAATADQLFPGEDVTKIDRLIHAWGYEKAARYIAKILA